MEYLDTIEECEELEDESFLLVVRRPHRSSHSLVKQSTPAVPDESHFTVSSDFSQPFRSKWTSLGQETCEQLPSLEKIGNSTSNHRGSSPFDSPKLLPLESKDSNDREDRTLVHRTATLAEGDSPPCISPPQTQHSVLEKPADCQTEFTGNKKSRKSLKISPDIVQPPVSRKKKRMKRHPSQSTKQCLVPLWLVNLMKNIEEATKHELVIE